MNRAKGLAVAGVFLLMLVQFTPSALAASSTPSQPAALALTIIPPKLPADGGVYPAAVVSLQDANGLATASMTNLTIFLSSDQTNIASVPAMVTIPAGSDYAIANISTTTTPGTAEITATSQGLESLKSVSVPVTTVIPSGYPSKLLVFASPSTFPAGLQPGHNNGTVRVEVVDQAGLPSKAINSIPVFLSSSNSSIASLAQSSLVIPAGSIYADGSFTVSEPGGPAFITAASSGYSSGFASVSVLQPNACTTSCVPAKLQLGVVASGSGNLPTDGGQYQVLEVNLQTQSGTPVAASTDVYVQLSSDNPGVASVQSIAVIPQGSTSTVATVTTTPLAGSATITAAPASANEQLSSATTTVTTLIPAPSKLQAYVAPPSTAYSTNGNYPILVVQLQDSTGNPARARGDTSIVVTSSNADLLGNLTVAIPKGSDYVFSLLHTKEVGESTLTAISTDLSSSQVDLKSVSGPLTTSLALSSTTNSWIYDNETATFTLTAMFDSLPVQNMNVSWTTTGGTLSAHSGNTGTSGTASTIFTPGSYGAYNITASADSPVTGPLALVYRLVVAQVPAKPAPSLLQRILGFWYYMVAAAAAVIVAVVYLFRMRRKKQRAEIEAGFEVV